MSNVISFSGVVGRDAEVRVTPSGQSVLNVTVANNVGYGDRQKTLWMQVSLWGKRAEGTLQQYLKKGQHVFISGELTQEEYQANDGTTKSSLRVNANILDLVGKKAESGTQEAPTPYAQAQQSSEQQPANRPVQQAQAQSQPATYEEFDDEIPF